MQVLDARYEQILAGTKNSVKFNVVLVFFVGV